MAGNRKLRCSHYLHTPPKGVTMNVVVIGGGMAGMLAAKACEDALGVIPTLHTDRLPRPVTWADMGGIHVLHNACGLTVAEMPVTNSVVMPQIDDPQLLATLSAWERKMANASYGAKVYGSRKASTSLMRMPGVIEGFDYVAAFNQLCEKYGGLYLTGKPLDERGLYALSKKYDMVITSVPRHHVTPNWVQHPLSMAYVSALPPVGFMPPKELGQHFVVYNTEPKDSWSRTARVMCNRKEYWSTEYNTIPKVAPPDLRPIEKVMASEDYAMPQNVLAVGRFGKWQPGVLAHDAYWDTIEELRRHG